MLVEREQRERVVILTLNRPDARNAINGDVAELHSLHAAAISGDELARVVWAEVQTQGQNDPFSRRLLGMLGETGVSGFGRRP